MLTKTVEIDPAPDQFNRSSRTKVRIATNTQKNAYEGLNYLVNPGVSLTLLPGFSYTSNLRRGNLL